MNEALGGVIITAALAISLFIYGKKWKEMSTTNKVVDVLVIVFMVSGGYYTFKKYSNEMLLRRIEAKIGTISDNGEAKEVTVKIGDGDSAAAFIIGDGVFSFASKPIYKFEIEDGKLYAYGVVRDFHAKPVAAIERNEWTLFSDEFEYQNNDHALELVTKGERKVFFQLYLKDGIAIFQGVAIDVNGKGKYWDGGISSGALVIPLWDEKKMFSFDLNESTAKRIFKYPRETHLGERVNP